MRRELSFVVLLQLAGALYSQPLAGSKACASCHRVEAGRHAASMHERALRPSTASQAPALFDRPVRERSGIEFNYETTPQGLMVEAQAGGIAQSALLEWIFGAGTLAFTPVGRLNGRYFEHRVSWYSSLQRPGMTLGHSAQGPSSAGAALGQLQAPETITRCFSCHATGVKPGPDLSSMIPGVQCERCHGPGVEHIKAPAGRNIRKLTGLSPVESVQVCAECHRMPEGDPAGTTPEQHDPMMIRFAPVGLLASKCFQASGKLTCVTCHDPHSGTASGKTSFESKCRSCHAAASVLKTRSAASSCPRETGGSCLNCHMVKATPVPGLTFTDHRIRVFPKALRN